jgi:hypothetical protein
MDDTMVQAVLTWLVPMTVHAMCTFLRLAGYYKHFIHDYGAITMPLTWLLKKEGFPEAEEAFRVLQRTLKSAPIMQLPAFNKEFIIECDASGSVFGAFLHQGDGAVGFFNWQIAPRHTKLVAYGRELNGLVQAVQHWRAYLWGHSSSTLTTSALSTCSTSAYLLSRSTNGRVSCWASTSASSTSRTP